MTRVAYLGAIALLAGLSLATGPALADPTLVRAEPAADSSVPAPKALDLIFSEPIVIDHALVVVRGADGKPVNTGIVVLNPGDDKRIHVPVAGTPAPGPVTVEWTVVSKAGQQTSGKYGFTVAG